jgi:signal transduction histidine kinase
MHDARWRPLLLIPVTAVAIGMITLARRPSFGEAPLDFLFDASTGLVLVAAGLIAWSRRPGARTGPLLVLAGYLWYVGSLYELVPDRPGNAVVEAIPFLGYTLRGYYDPILAWIVLTFPGRRLETRVDRVVLAALVALMVVRTGARLARADAIVDEGLTVAVGGVLIAIALAAVRRRWRIPAGARRATDPVLVGGAIWAALAGLYAIDPFFHDRLRIDLVPWDGPGWTVQYLLRILGPVGLLIGAVRLRGGSAVAVGLMAGPDGPPHGAGLEQALRRALDDPALLLLNRSADGTWADSLDRPTAGPQAGPGRATTLLERDGQVTGAIVHDATLLDDPALVRTLAAAVGLAVDNERLQANLRDQLEEVQASRARIVEAGDAERRRVERDLHDGAQQRLVALAVSLRTIRTRLGPGVAPAALAELDAADELVMATIADVRELARGLDPSILREAGLGAAVHSLADHSSIPVAVAIELDGRLPARTETAAYFVAAEALANAAKHSRATRIQVGARQVADVLELEVRDDGTGGADLQGSGIRGLADRIAAVGGTFAVDSPLGGGTLVRASIPCGS